MSDGPSSALSIDVVPTAAWLLANLERLVAALPPERLAGRRWFGSKGQGITAIALRDAAILSERPPAVLALIDVALAGAGSETYSLPLALRPSAEAAALESGSAAAFLALESSAGTFLLYDATADPECARALYALLAAGARLSGRRGRFVFVGVQTLPAAAVGEPRSLGVEQSNTSIRYGDRSLLKLYRRLQDGPNPDLEVPLFLSTRAGFPYSPPLLGYAEYAGPGLAATLASLQAFVANEGDGWREAQAQLRGLLGAAQAESDMPAGELVWGHSAAYLEQVRRLGQVTAELHLSLSSDRTDPAFAPEPVTEADLEAWMGSTAASLRAALAAAEAAAGHSPPLLAGQLRALAGAEDRYLALLGGLRALAAAGVEKIRLHGDYHLGQVLRVPDGFVIVDFEGEPARPLAERRAKHLALRDVAGMLRSFDYAAAAGLKAVEGYETARLALVASAWAELTAEAFLAGYLAGALQGSASLIPSNPELLRRALDALLLDKALYELTYELDNRPDWVDLPLRYLVRLAALT